MLTLIRRRFSVRPFLISGTSPRRVLPGAFPLVFPAPKSPLTSASCPGVAPCPVPFLRSPFPFAVGISAPLGLTLEDTIALHLVRGARTDCSNGIPSDPCASPLLFPNSRAPTEFLFCSSTFLFKRMRRFPARRASV